MRNITYLKVEAVEGQTPKEYAETLSKRLYELRAVKPEIDRVDITTCYLTYNIEELIAETLEDKYELAGCSMRCGNCPYFERELNRKGEPMGNSKRGYCKLENRDTFRNIGSPADEKCYAQFELEGGIEWISQMKN